MKRASFQRCAALFLAICAVAFVGAHATTAQAQSGKLTSRTSLTSLVNPFIGTDGTGHAFPGAARPFGMVAPSPDNASRGWDYTSGYQYRAARILGFSNTHISGAGIPELGDVLLQPASGTHWDASTSDFSAAYDKASETASPGYYRLNLAAHGVQVELSALQRVALQRYTFTRGGKVQVLADFQHGLIQVEGPHVRQAEVALDAAKGALEGTIHTKNWVERQYSFALRFSRPIIAAVQLPAADGEKAPRYLLTFDLGSSRVLEARVAFSTVDPAGARGNLHSAGWPSFEQVRHGAAQEWEALLGRVLIEAPLSKKRIFYSALYRSFLHPSDIADADGRVRGPDGKVMQAPGGKYYSTFSLWDTFRAVQPLFTLLVPERVDGMIASLLAHAKAVGTLPLWTAWGQETWTMIGNPALPVVADAIAKGFKGLDYQEAFAAMRRSVEDDRPSAPEWAQRDWRVYRAFGYLPFDRVEGEAVSQTLEFGIGDDAVARVARVLGDEATAQRYAAYAQSYKMLFDPRSQLMRGRDAKGNWRTPFDPIKATSPLNNPGDYTEANAWQYTPTPGLHDPRGLAALFGGPREFGDWLDRFFMEPMPTPDKFLGQEAMIGQYAHGNEPGHHIAFLYAYTDRPWKRQSLLRQITQDFYRDAPDGIMGNDDCGQMSAWYILAQLGLYPVVPASGTWLATPPLVKRASLTLAGGRQLTILRDLPLEADPKEWRLNLNAQPLSPLDIPHARLTGGGSLRFFP